MSGKTSIDCSYTKANRLGIIIQYVWLTGEYVSYVNTCLKESNDKFYETVGRQGVVQLILDSFREDLMTSLMNETSMDRNKLQRIFSTQMIISTEVLKLKNFHNLDRFEAIIDSINDRVLNLPDAKIIHDEVMAQIQMMKEICKKSGNTRGIEILVDIETNKIPAKEDMNDHSWHLVKLQILDICRVKRFPSGSTPPSKSGKTKAVTRSQSATAALTTDMVSLKVSPPASTAAKKSSVDTKKDEGSSGLGRLLRSRKTKKNQDGMIEHFDSIEETPRASNNRTTSVDLFPMVSSRS
ncbi:unnamed protein product [Caenorhabditis angaria]|uniref:Uncharacterized protein n=1 Tax=Caenorhabditis angaria TaxID=860376 RepID=A0A9P1N9G0_9PELO|nr:unnamed protein product [Caenorhabditis angaria]